MNSLILVFKCLQEEVEEIGWAGCELHNQQTQHRLFSLHGAPAMPSC